MSPHPPNYYSDELSEPKALTGDSNRYGIGGTRIHQLERRARFTAHSHQLRFMSFYGSVWNNSSSVSSISTFITVMSL